MNGIIVTITGCTYIVCCCDDTTIKMARKPVKLLKGKSTMQDALGKVNGVNEIRRKEKDGSFR